MDNECYPSRMCWRVAPRDSSPQRATLYGIQDPSRPRGIAHPVRSIAGWFTGAWEGAGPGSRRPSRSVRRSGTRPV